MQSSALIQRTKHLVEQADQALHRTPSIQALAGLTRQLGALQCLLEGYGLRLSSGRLTAQHVTSGLYAEDDRMAVATSLPSAAALSGRTAEKALEHHRWLAEMIRSENQPPILDLLQQAHSSATPTAMPERQALDVVEPVGSNEERVHLRAPAGRAVAGRPPLRQTTLPVTNITQVKTTSPATLPTAAITTQAEAQHGGSLSRRAQAHPMIMQASKDAPPAPVPSRSPWPSDQVAATAASFTPQRNALEAASEVPAHQPDYRRSGLLPRRLLAASVNPDAFREQRLEFDDRASPWPARSTRSPPAVGRVALERPEAGLPPQWLHDVDGKPLLDADSQRTAVLAEPDEDLQQLAEQLERLLRDEARRHGIEL